MNKSGMNRVNASYAEARAQAAEVTVHTTLARRTGLLPVTLLLGAGIMPTFAWADGEDEYTDGIVGGAELSVAPTISDTAASEVVPTIFNNKFENTSTTMTVRVFPSFGTGNSASEDVGWSVDKRGC